MTPYCPITTVPPLSQLFSPTPVGISTTVTDACSPDATQQQGDLIIEFDILRPPQPSPRCESSLSSSLADLFDSSDDVEVVDLDGPADDDFLKRPLRDDEERCTVHPDDVRAYVMSQVLRNLLFAHQAQKQGVNDEDMTS